MMIKRAPAPTIWEGMGWASPSHFLEVSVKFFGELRFLWNLADIAKLWFNLITMTLDE